MKNPFIENESFLKTHPKSFAHLHLHTQYSLLDGAIRLDDLFEKCKEYNMPAVACTDHGNMFGAIDFYTKAIKAGVKPLVGSEIYFTPGSRFDRRVAKKSATISSQDEMESRHQIHHLVLICKNLTGYKNLCQLLSKAYLEGFYYKPRADYELLREHSEGLIATSACLKGEVAYNIFTNQDEKAIGAIDNLKEIYGEDFYLEIQENGLAEQVKVNKKIIQFAKEKDIPLVATCDSHYVNREDARAQEVLLCIQTGKTFNDEKRMKLTSDEFFIKSPEQMREAFHYMEEACDNTLKIADKCNLEITWEDEDGNQVYHLPDFEIDTGETPADFFKRISREGLEKRFVGPHFRKIIKEENWESELKAQYYERLESELDMICKMGFPGYFLIVSDFIQWSKNNNIPVGPGRGSGAGSLVAYALDITNINPLPYNLLFERFINPERISMPDFDIDFCQDRRQEVIEYVTQKYGEERVGQIITFGKLQAKAAVRDVSRVFGLPYSEADMVAKLIPDELGIKLQEAIDKEPKLKELEEKDPKIRQILGISKRLEGLMRHASIHAAGVIITNEPLVSYCPLYKGREGERVVQFDKDFSEQIGLVKFDFLGLKTLTVVENAAKFIRRDHKSDFDIEDIDLEDSDVYGLIGEGDTTGVFQLESSGMKDLCKRIKPDTLDDITAINALYRPGPMKSGMHEEFIDRKHGIKRATYTFDSLVDVLRDTYGIIVYQEQVMNISRIVAGYSLGQADMLRRAMGKKKVKEMDRHKEIFREGALENGYDEKKALELFDLMANFAEYGFNKSHAVAYAYIAYQTAYLKHYYAPSFYAALLGTELNNTDKVTVIIQDAREHGIEILPPDINESLWLFNVVGETIRFGMGAIKNVGKSAVEELVREREESGNFEGFIDFCERINHKAINKRVVESLIKVGAFDNCDDHNRKTLLENLELVYSYGQKRKEEKLSGQGSFFDLVPETTQKSDVQIDECVDFEAKEKLTYEKQLMGIYISGHPLEPFARIMEELSSMTINEVSETMGNGKRDMVLCGMFESYKSFISKKGDKMAFATLEDLSGKMECIVFPRTFGEYSHLLDSTEALVLTGTVNLDEDPRKFFPSKIIKLKDVSDQSVQKVEINLRTNQLSDFSLDQIKRALLGFRGTTPVVLRFFHPLGKGEMALDNNYNVQASPQLATKINQILDADSVQFKMDDIKP